MDSKKDGDFNQENEEIKQGFIKVACTSEELTTLETQIDSLKLLISKKQGQNKRYKKLYKKVKKQDNLNDIVSFLIKVILGFSIFLSLFCYATIYANGGSMAS